MPGYAGDITATEAWEMLAGNPTARLVDVRTKAEWQWVGVPDTSALGAAVIFVSWAMYPSMDINHAFVDHLQAAGLTPGSDTPVIFLCRSGKRSIAAATAATAAGIGPSYQVLDGFEGDLDAHGHRGQAGWKAAGLPWRQS